MFTFETDLYDKLIAKGIQREDAEGHLRRFLSLFGRQFDILRRDIENVVDAVDVDTCPVELLPHLGKLIGLQDSDFGFDTTDTEQREQIRWAVRVWKSKGTEAGILYMCRFMLGTPTELLAWRKNIFRTFHPLQNRVSRTWHPAEAINMGTHNDTIQYTYGYRFQEGYFGLWLQPGTEEGLRSAFNKYVKLQTVLRDYISATAIPVIIFEGILERELTRAVKDIFIPGEMTYTTPITDYLREILDSWVAIVPAPEQAVYDRILLKTDYGETGIIKLNISKIGVSKLFSQRLWRAVVTYPVTEERFVCFMGGVPLITQTVTTMKTIHI